MLICTGHTFAVHWSRLVTSDGSVVTGVHWASGSTKINNENYSLSNNIAKILYKKGKVTGGEKGKDWWEI